MSNCFIPDDYSSHLSLRQTELAIKKVKDFFERDLAIELNLTRVTAPLFVPAGTGLNDNLNGVERPVDFDTDGAPFNNVLKSIEEKPEYSFLTNTAMYLVEPGVLKDMKKNRKIDFPDFIRGEQENGKKIGIYSVAEEDWLDMGQMSELEKMRIRLYGE